jgi:hypothetical protein
MIVTQQAPPPLLTPDEWHPNALFLMPPLEIARQITLIGSRCFIIYSAGSVAAFSVHLF